MKKLSDRQIFERSITEEDVFSACRGLLELNGARVFRIVERIPWGRKKSEPGIPDLTGWFPGPRAVITGDKGQALGEPFSFYCRHFWIEIKKPGGAHRPAQERWIEDARRDGVIAFFASSVDAMAKGFAEYGIHLKGL